MMPGAHFNTGLATAAAAKCNCVMRRRVRGRGAGSGSLCTSIMRVCVCSCVRMHEQWYNVQNKGDQPLPRVCTNS